VDLKENTMLGYRQKVKAFFGFCEKNFYDKVFGKEALEQYILHLWRKGNLKQSPESFRSALKKVCMAAGKPDPFTPKMRHMIKAFSVDQPKPVPKFIKTADLAKISAAVKGSGRKDWRDVLELMFFSIWQNVRISTLVEIKYDDVFPSDGGIYLAFVKGHRGAIWTILHPIAESIVREKKARTKDDQSPLLIGDWTETSLGLALDDICRAAKVPSCTWHCLRHTGTQYMNDLAYGNELLQALGTWKVCFSMKTYIRDRKGVSFSKKSIEMHRKCRATLSERLRKLRGRMKWWPAREPEPSVLGV
jgi:site-specific recombinase XerD